MKVAVVTAVALLIFRVIQVWARAGGGVHKPPEEIVWNEAENWGVGDNIVTKLYSDKQEVRSQSKNDVN